MLLYFSLLLRFFSGTEMYSPVARFVSQAQQKNHLNALKCQLCNIALFYLYSLLFKCFKNKTQFFFSIFACVGAPVGPAPLLPLSVI